MAQKSTTELIREAREAARAKQQAATADTTQTQQPKPKENPLKAFLPKAPVVASPQPTPTQQQTPQIPQQQPVKQGIEKSFIGNLADAVMIETPRMLGNIGQGAAELADMAPSMFRTAPTIGGSNPLVNDGRGFDKFKPDYEKELEKQAQGTSQPALPGVREFAKRQYKKADELTEKRMPDAESWGYLVGSLAPQSAGIATAVGVGAFNPAAGLALGAASTGGLTLMSAGAAAKEYDDYVAEKGIEPDANDKLASMMLSMAAEMGSEAIPVAKFVPKGFRGRMSKFMFGDTEVATKTARELFDQFINSNQSRKQLAKNLAREIGEGALTEGPTEGIAELGNEFSTWLYKEKEDRATWQELRDRTFKAIAGGAIMGAGIGPLSYGAQQVQNQRRRKQSGKVIIAQDSNTGEAVEIMGMANADKEGAPPKDQAIVYQAIRPNGKIYEVDENNIASIVELPLEDFNGLLKGKGRALNEQAQQKATAKKQKAQAEANNIVSQFQSMAYQGPDGTTVITGAKYNDEEVFVTNVFPDGTAVIQKPGEEKKVVRMDGLTDVETRPFDDFVAAFAPPQAFDNAQPTAAPIQKGEEVTIDGQTYVVTGFNIEQDAVQLENIDDESDLPPAISVQEFEQLRAIVPQQPQQASQAAEELRSIFLPQSNQQEFKPGEQVSFGKEQPQNAQPAQPTVAQPANVPTPTAKPVAGSPQPEVVGDGGQKPGSQGVSQEVSVDGESIQLQNGFVAKRIKGKSKNGDTISGYQIINPQDDFYKITLLKNEVTGEYGLGETNLDFQRGIDSGILVPDETGFSIDVEKTIKNLINQPTNESIQQTKTEAQKTKPTEATAPPVRTEQKESAYETARKQGFVEKDGVRYERQKPVQAVKGSEVSLEFAKDVNEKANYAVVESSQIQPSHRKGQQNPLHFIPEAQPKNRKSASSQESAMRIAKTLDPSKVAQSPNPYSGSPVINSRGEVIQGNNRTDAIQQYWEINPQDTNGYKQYLIDNAAQFGLDPEQIKGMKNPVLTRMVGAGDSRAIELGNYDVKDIESAGQRRIDPIATVNRLGKAERTALLNIMSQSNGNTLAKIVREQIGRITKFLYDKGAINSTQLETIINPTTGEAKPAGIEDISGIFKQFIFRGGDTNLPDLFNGLPDRVQKGIEKAIPDILNAPTPLLFELQQAIMAFSQYSTSTIENYKDWATQPDMFNGGMAPLAIFNPLSMNMVERFDKSKTQAEIAKLFKEYNQLTTGSPANLLTSAIPGLSPQEAVQKTFGINHDPIKFNTATERQDDSGQRQTVTSDPAAKGKDGSGKNEGPSGVGSTPKREQGPAGDSDGAGSKAEPPAEGPKGAGNDLGGTVTPSKSDQLSAEAQKKAGELKDLFNDFFDAGKNNLTSGGITPEQFAIAGKIITKAGELGIVRFKQLVEWANQNMGDKMRQYFDSFKAAFGANLMINNPEGENINEIAASKFEDYVNSPEANQQNNVPNRPADGQQDRELPDAVQADQKPIPGGREDVGNDREGNIQPGIQAEQPKDRPSGLGVSTPVSRKSSNKPVQQQLGIFGTSSEGTGIANGRGDSLVGPAGNDAGRAGDVPVDQGTKDRIESFADSFKRKIKLQAEAEKIPAKLLDKDNIRETLPVLLDEQQEDVIRAEERFFGEQHKKPELANGKGYLFTNGTGTGKTFTGLGVAKRFIKQGKGNILLVVPGQPKVADWKDAAEKLGITINPLANMKDAGKGFVATTYKNFEGNLALRDRDWDLIIYDESHLLMADQYGKESGRTVSHYKHSGVSEFWALEKLKDATGLWVKQREILGQMRKINLRINKDDTMNEVFQEGIAERKKLEEELKQVEAEQEKILPSLKERAKKNYENTKVLFLSASPFATVKNLEYANGTLFDWGDKITYEQASRVKSEVDPRSRFFLDNFGAAYRWRNHRLEPQDPLNAEAVAMQEIAFGNKLAQQGVMSGRAIESNRDYARHFPLVTGFNRDLYNDAINEIYKSKGKYNRLSAFASKQFFEYENALQLMESMRTSMSLSRIDEHLKLGRKVVIFHKRHKADVSAPFAQIVMGAKLTAQAGLANPLLSSDEKKRLSEMLEQAEAFEQDFSELLRYEQTLDYSSTVDQISKKYGDQAVYFNGNVNTKEKIDAIRQFNDDNSNVKIIVVHEQSGREGISLHDTTGKHQRVLMSMSLPSQSITTLQVEGRIYRIGQESDAVLEYPILGLDTEIAHFASKINKKVSTTENLAMGDGSRDLLKSFAFGVMNASDEAPSREQGKGGKELDKREREEHSQFKKARLVYAGNQKIRGTRQDRQGVDFYPTPEPVGQKMVEWLYLQPTQKFLEPSAGKGAIAMWAPGSVKTTAIEPAMDLIGRLGSVIQNGETMQIDFMEHNIINKYDGIAMNPPFGSAGATAIEHLSKATKHLRNGGRVVALIPVGSTDKKFDNFMESKDASDLYVRAEILLPSVTFEKAGTAVNTRIVVIDKVNKPVNESDLTIPSRTIDLRNAKTVDELFDRLENISMPDKIKVQGKEQDQSEADAVQAVEDILNTPLKKPSVIPSTKANEGDLKQDEFTHTKTGEKIPRVTMEKRFTSDEFQNLKKVAQANNGYWSGYAKGFLFDSKENAAKFIQSFGGTNQEADIRFMRQPSRPIQRPVRYQINDDYYTLIDIPERGLSAVRVKVDKWGEYQEVSDDLYDAAVNYSTYKDTPAYEGQKQNHEAKIEALKKAYEEAIKKDKALPRGSFGGIRPRGRAKGTIPAADVRFSKSASSLAALVTGPRQAKPTKSAIDVSEKAAKFTKDWKNAPRITTVNSAQDAFERYPSLAANGFVIDDLRDVPAIFINGEVVLIASHPYHADKNATEKALLHEIIGHYGVREFIKRQTKGDQGKYAQEMDKLMGQIFDAKKDDKFLQSIAKNYFKKPVSELSEKQKLTVADEYIAHIAESGVEDSWVDRVVAKLRQVLRELGINIGLSDREIRALIGNSMRVVRGSKGVPVLRLMAAMDSEAMKMLQENRNAMVIDGFYSPIEKKILEFKQPKASATKWKEIIGRKDEAVWTGIAGYLDGLKPDQQVSKQELLDWMKDNRVRIEVVEKMDASADARISKQKALEKWNEGIEIYGVYLDGVEYLITDVTDFDLFDYFLTIEQVPLTNPTKYFSYQLPGDKTDYKEVLVTLPVKGKTITVSEKAELETLQRRQNNELNFPEKDLLRLRELMQKSRDSFDNKSKFKSTHWDEPNILVHLRMNTRTDADGNKVLFLEEVQSDWGQKGKKEGFFGDLPKLTPHKQSSWDDNHKIWRIGEGNAPLVEYNSFRKETPYRATDWAGAEIGRFKTKEEAAIAANAGRFGTVPSAPFVTDTNAWVKLGLKIALQEAVSQGVDKIAWTTGEQQNERYDLSKQVDRIEPLINADGTYLLEIYKDGSRIMSKNVSENELEATVGKEVAQKIIDDAKPWKSVAKQENESIQLKKLSGLDLKVGGTGMKAFYGDPSIGDIGIVGRVAESIIGRGGVQQTNFNDSFEDWYKKNRAKTDPTWDQYQSLPQNEQNEFMEAYNEEMADLSPKKVGIQHSITITPQIAEMVTGGMPLFMIKPSDQTQTPAFKAWFGDSKVVDSEGRPLVVYHGTEANFDVFMPGYTASSYPQDNIGAHFGTAKAASDRLKESTYNQLKASIMPVYLSIPKLWKDKVFESETALRKALNETAIKNNRDPKSKSFFIELREQFAKEGIGIAYKNSEEDRGSISYIATSPTQIKSATGNIGTFDPQNPDIRFMKLAAKNADFSAINAKNYEEGKLSWFDLKVTERLQDRMIRSKRLIESKTKDVSDKADFYTKENLASGKTLEKARTFEKDLWNPLLETAKKIVKQSGLTSSDISDYLKFKHHDERKKYFFEKEGLDEAGKQRWMQSKIVAYGIDPALQAKYTLAEYEARIQKQWDRKIANLDPKWPTGMTDQEAANGVANFESSVSPELVAELQKRVQKVNLFTTVERFKAGMITKETYKDLLTRYQNYVPLTDWKGMEQNNDRVYTLLMSAKGRSSEAADPLPFMFTAAQEAIMRGENNRVRQSVLQFVKENVSPGDYFIRQAYYVNTKSKDEFGNDIWLETMNKPTDKQLKSGEAMRSFNPEVHRSVQQQGELANVLPVMVKGKKVFIEFKDSKIPMAIKNLDQDKVPRFLQIFRNYTRWLSSMYTQYSPEFGLRNLIRDVGFGTFNILVEKDAKTWGSTMKKMPKSGVTLRKFFATGEYAAGNDGNLLREFMEEGAMTGFTDLKTAADVFAEAKTTIDKANRNNAWAKGGNIALMPIRALGHGIEVYNKILENSMRFSYYKTLREQGISKQKAAIMAKDLTVNFNRKGRHSAFLGSFYIFFNASVQGSERLIRSFTNPKTRRKAMGYAGVVFATGMIQSLLYGLFDEEDEDGKTFYEKIPDYTRRNNIIIPNLTTNDPGDYIKVPLPYGLNIFYSMGESLGRVMTGKGTAGEEALGIASAATNVFSPLGGMEFGKDDSNGFYDLFSVVSPSVSQPAVDLAFNRNFAGRRIYREQSEFAKYQLPSSQMYFEGVNPYIREATTFLNNITGGDEVTPGVIDWNPEFIEHGINQYLGGPAQFTQNLGTTVWEVLHGKDVSDDPYIRRVPFVRSFVGKSGTDFEATQNFYEYRDNALAAKGAYEAKIEAGQDEKAEEYYRENQALIDLAEEYKAYDKAVRNYNQTIATLKKESKELYRDDIDKLYEERTKLMREFNRRYGEVMFKKRGNPLKSILQIN